MKRYIAYIIYILLPILVAILVASCTTTSNNDVLKEVQELQKVIKKQNSIVKIEEFCIDYKVLQLKDDVIFWITDIEDSVYKQGDIMNLDGAKFKVLQVRKHRIQLPEHSKVQLMTEEPLKVGDTLMVQYVGNDSVYIGYTDAKFVR